MNLKSFSYPLRRNFLIEREILIRVSAPKVCLNPRINVGLYGRVLTPSFRWVFVAIWSEGADVSVLADRHVWRLGSSECVRVVQSGSLVQKLQLVRCSGEVFASLDYISRAKEPRIGTGDGMGSMPFEMQFWTSGTERKSSFSRYFDAGPQGSNR